MLIALVLVIGGVFAAFRFVQDNNSTDTAEVTETENQSASVKIKNLPIEIDTYDPVTGKAGEVVFPKEEFAEGALDMIFSSYGFVVPASSAGAAKANPQPTFLAPLGTKVRALIDGEVVAVTELYSGDFSIHMLGEGSELIFETEHVINVTVEVGDQVKAGTEIAEVSDYDAHNYAGLGLVEIGVLKGGNPPSHLCTFDFLDDSIKTETLQKITQLQDDWEAFRGNTDLYGEEAIPGCVTQEIIND